MKDLDMSILQKMPDNKTFIHWYRKEINGNEYVSYGQYVNSDFTSTMHSKFLIHDNSGNIVRTRGELMNDETLGIVFMDDMGGSNYDWRVYAKIFDIGELGGVQVISEDFINKPSTIKTLYPDILRLDNSTFVVAFRNDEAEMEFVFYDYIKNEMITKHSNGACSSIYNHPKLINIYGENKFAVASGSAFAGNHYTSSIVEYNGDFDIFCYNRETFGVHADNTPTFSTIINSDNDYIIVWQEPGNVYYQIFDSDGKKKGLEYTLIINDVGKYLDVARIYEDVIVIVYSRLNTSPYISGRIIDIDIDSNTTLDTFEVTTESDVFQPSIEVLEEGSFVVTYKKASFVYSALFSYNYDGYEYIDYYQKYKNWKSDLEYQISSDDDGDDDYDGEFDTLLLIILITLAPFVLIVGILFFFILMISFCNCAQKTKASIMDNYTYNDKGAKQEINNQKNVSEIAIQRMPIDNSAIPFNNAQIPFNNAAPMQDMTVNKQTGYVPTEEFVY